MIHSFSYKNFYSLKDSGELSFVVNENAPDNHSYYTSPSGVRLSKIETVIGPNASGKTNLLKVIPFLKWLIVDSFNTNPGANLPIRPFMFGSSKNKPSELSVTFEIDSSIYTYTFILDDERIFSEQLTLKSEAHERSSSKKLFVRTWDKEEGVYEFTDNNFGLPNDFQHRANASILSLGMRLNHKPSLEIADFWQNAETNVMEAGWASNQLLTALHFFSENEALKKKAEDLLSRFDLGLNGFNIIKEKREEGFFINAEISHDFNGKKHYLPNLSYESSGTMQLLTVLQTILQTLDKGGVAILDEFEVNLHPEIVMALFELFIQPETNPHNAQILLSTHSHLILSRLDKYQITLVEKNEDGGSHSWRLDEMAGVRADDNYYAKYIAGAYGAIPNL